MKIDIIHSDDEEVYNVQDIDVLCKYDIGEIEDINEIDRFIMENVKKGEKKSYEMFNQEDIIKETEIGLDIMKKYKLALSTKTPIKFIYKQEDIEEQNNQYYSVRDILKDQKQITQLLEKLYKKNRIKTSEFLFAYYFSNSDKNDKFLLNQFNKLTIITGEEYDLDDIKEKRSQYEKLFKVRMNITKKKYKKIQKFYEDLNKLDYSNLPEKINSTLNLESTLIEIDVLDKNSLINIDLGPIFFNSISASYIFPFIQLNSMDEKYYKIYERENNFSYLLNEKEKLFNNLEDENDKNKIFIIMRLERITTLNYILIQIDLNKSILRFEYPSDSLIPIKKEILLSAPNIQFKEERIISTNGYFNFNIRNYDEFKFYYLTHFDPIINKFIYINENKRPRSLKENLKFYFRSYEDSNIYIDYSIYFYITKVHGNNYEIKFNSKIIDQKNIVNEFALILSKIFYHYQEYNFEESSLPFITNEYTGPDGSGLGGKEPVGFTEGKFIPKSKKIDNLITIAPELFPKNEYARQCLCPKQPIIIDDDDIEDWEKYDRNVYIFPPLFSKQKSKRYNFVCPTENSVMNFIRNPDIQSPFPILPCCSQQQNNEYYRYYDEIIKEGDKFWNIKEEEKSKMIQKKKTISILSTEQEGDVPEELNTFLKKMYSEHDTGNFIRIGVMKNSRSSFIHCLVKGCDHLEFLLENATKTKSKKHMNIFDALIKIRKKYLYAPLTKREVNIIDFRKQLEKFVNLEVAKQELYNYNIRQISDILNNQKEIFDSKTLYRLLENIFYVNIFVFEYDGSNQIRLEKPRGRFYNQREINIKLPSIFIFKHFGKQLPTYELIRNTQLLPDSNKTYLFGHVATKYMKEYVDKKGYYMCHYDIKSNKYQISKNYQSNINWNYLLSDYTMLEQFINDSGRAYAITFIINTEGDKMTIFIPSSYPLNLPEGNTVYEKTTKECYKIFGKDRSQKGSNGLWYKINDKERAMFVPCTDIKASDDIELISKDYIVSKNIFKNKKGRNKNKINKLNTVKRNTTILVQIILWMWNISEIKVLDVWWDQFVDMVDNQKEMETIASVPFKVELRFPDIKNTTEAIEYFNHYMPFIFYERKINLYHQLHDRVYQYIKNYIIRTEGYEEKIVNKAIIGIFSNESDFDPKIFNKIIIGEKNYDDWQNFIENINNDYTNLSDIFITQKRPFLYKDENGEIFLIQNNINNNLTVSILICKVWKEIKINLGYYTTETNIWRCVKCDPRLYDIFKLDDQKVIDLAKKYTPENIRIESFNHALEVLEKEKIAFEIDEEDMNYYTKNSQNYINKEHVNMHDPYSLFSYDNGGLASILPIA